VPLTSSDASPIVGPSESLARANPADHAPQDDSDLLSSLQKDVKVVGIWFNDKGKWLWYNAVVVEVETARKKGC
jgi:hypothetical protein